MFIGREKELKRLDTMYHSDKLEIAIVYGRRRVGKTTLINEFCKGKPTVFLSMESSARLNLEGLSKAISDMTGDESCLRLQQFLRMLLQKSRNWQKTGD